MEITIEKPSDLFPPSGFIALIISLTIDPCKQIKDAIAFSKSLVINDKMRKDEKLKILAIVNRIELFLETIGNLFRTAKTKDAHLRSMICVFRLDEEEDIYFSRKLLGTMVYNGFQEEEIVVYKYLPKN